MMEHIQGHTTHTRRGAVRNAFRYGVDYVLVDPASTQTPRLLSRNRFNLWSLHDRHHGGERGAGRSLAWFRELLEDRGFPLDGAELKLLTQPSFLWFTFNPVSFWIAVRDGTPRAFVAEVNNTFGHRHCYFCAHEDFRPIAPSDTLVAAKLMHVSPFQEISGLYRFNFGLTERAVKIRILYENGGDGVTATLSGERQPATDASLLRAAVRRPLGALRVLALIHWQALVLFAKRAPFLSVPPPPEVSVTDSGPIRSAAE